MAVWLATQEGVVCPNLRDIFSAGGKECITKNGESYSGVSKVIGKLYRELSAIKEFIQQVDDAELQEYWKCQFNIGENGKRGVNWQSIILKQSTQPESL